MGREARELACKGLLLPALARCHLDLERFLIDTIKRVGPSRPMNLPQPTEYDQTSSAEIPMPVPPMITTSISGIQGTRSPERRLGYEGNNDFLCIFDAGDDA